MNSWRRTLWLYGFLALLAGPLLAAEYAGRVTAVHDGDILTLLVPDGTSYQQIKVSPLRFSMICFAWPVLDISWFLTCYFT